MQLSQIVKGKKIDKSSAPLRDSDIVMAEVFLEAKIGRQLKEYLTEYGYIGCGSIGMYGINRRTIARSDMVTTTVMLHEYHPRTEGLIAIENQGDGDYFLVDEDDNVYRFVMDNKRVKKLNKKLFGYISQRLSTVRP